MDVEKLNMMAGGFLALTYMLSPAIAFVPLFATLGKKAGDEQKIWASIALFAVFLGVVNFLMELSGGNDFGHRVFRSYVVPAASLIFCGLLVTGSNSLHRINGVLSRIVAGLSLVLLVPVGFSGIAYWASGEANPLSMPQLGFEYLYRTLDLLSFTTMSAFNIARYDESVVLTENTDVTVIVFNIFMGVVGLSAIYRLLVPWRKSSK